MPHLDSNCPSPQLPLVPARTCRSLLVQQDPMMAAAKELPSEQVVQQLDPCSRSCESRDLEPGAFSPAVPSAGLILLLK